MTEGRQPDLSAVLARRRALEAKKDEILKLIEERFGEVNYWPKPTQLQNLRTIAASTDSVKEVKIFIQYQMSRTGAPIGAQLGNALLDAIGSLEEPNDPLLSIEKVRYFLGNLARYAAYKRKAPGRPEEEEGG